MQQVSLSPEQRTPLLAALVAGVAGLVVGVIVGLLMGWNADAAPQHLGEAYAAKYVQSVADSYALVPNEALAIDRMKDFPDYAQAIEWASRLSQGDLDAQTRLLTLKTLLDAKAATGELPAGGSGLNLMGVVLALLALLVLAGAGIGGFLYFRHRMGSERPATAPVEQSAANVGAQISAQYMAEQTAGASAPTVPNMSALAEPDDANRVSRWVTTYVLGDDLYDDSFSIDDTNGDFLGECGVGIGETIGVGDPKKVQTFEIWLFDKNDIRTVTHVLMSEHAFNDEALKSKLAAKGQPALAQLNGELVLETAELMVRARIVEMQYGSAPLPPNSFFQQITIELQAYKKGDAGDLGPADFG